MMRNFKVMQHLNNLLNAARRQQVGERGDTLPATLVSTIVGAIMLVICGGLILTTLNSQNLLSADNTVLATSATLETTFRADLSNASLISPTSSTDMVLTVPGRNSQCKTAEWVISSGSITRIITNYTDQALSSSGLVACAGTQGSPISVNMAKNVGSAAAFAYSNRAGRSLTATTTSGTTTVGYTNASDAQPSGTTASEWASLVIAQVAASFTVTNGSGSASNNTQTITQLSGSANPLPASTGTANSGSSTSAGSSSYISFPSSMSAPTGNTPNVLGSSTLKLTFSAPACPAGTTNGAYNVFASDATTSPATNVPVSATFATSSGTVTATVTVPNTLSNIPTASTANGSQAYSVTTNCIVTATGQPSENFSSANSSTIVMTMTSPSAVAAPTYTSASKKLTWTAPSTQCTAGSTLYYAPQFSTTSAFTTGYNLYTVGTGATANWLTATSYTIPTSPAPANWSSTTAYYYRVLSACFNDKSTYQKTGNVIGTVTSAAVK